MPLGNSILVFPSGGGGIESIIPGSGISIDNTDPDNPIISSSGANITVVANYSALPDPTTVSGQFYWCSASQGTAWLPGSIGGTYYSAGLYYSNGTTWEYLDVPYQATQAGVDAGIITDQFITPFTFQNSTQLAGKISLDGSSPATTGNILIGDNYGLEDTSSVYNSTLITSEIKMFSPDGAYFGSKPIKISAKSANYGSVMGFDDFGWTHNTTNSFGGTSYMSVDNFGGYHFQQINGGSFANFSFSLNNGFRLKVGNAASRGAAIKTSLLTGSGYHNYEFPDYGGTFAMLSDIPSVSGYITLTSLSQGAGIAYNNTTGVIALDYTYANIWTNQQTATSWYANGTAGNGYLRLLSQSATPAAVAGSMIIYSDASNRFSIVRRNNANSADITRTLNFPDFNYICNFPTPASGGTSDLAGLNTAQTWTQQQTFSGTHRMGILQILDNDGINYKSAIRGNTGLTNQLIVGASSDGFTSLFLHTNNTFVQAGGWWSTGTGNLQGFVGTRFQSTGGTTLNIANQPNVAGQMSIGGSWNTSTGAYLSDYASTAGPNDFMNSLRLETGSQTNNTGTTGLGLTIRSGGTTSATNVNNGASVYMYTREIVLNGTASSGSLLFDTGLTAAGASGAGIKGGIGLFNNVTIPTWNGLQRGVYWNNATAEATTNPASGGYLWMFGNKFKSSQSIVFPFVGAGLEFKTGTNARVGTTTLISGTITVANTSVTANTKVKVQLVSVNGGTLGDNYKYTVNAGVGFTITSISSVDVTVATDVAILDWYLTEFI